MNRASVAVALGSGAGSSLENYAGSPVTLVVIEMPRLDMERSGGPTTRPGIFDHQKMCVGIPLRKPST